MYHTKEELSLILERYSKIVEPKIRKILVLGVDKKFQELVEHQIVTGGKRLRPGLTMISCQLLGGKIKDALWCASGLEILHNYVLIIDDIIDNSALRRGKPTVWFKFGPSMAECAAIDYSAAIFQAANLSPKPAEISELFAKTLKKVVDGEILDILFEQAGREREPYVLKNRYFQISEKDYFEMAGKKTAFLLQACCEAGGIVAGASKKEITVLRKYGFNLGLAFQIQDDILDIFGEEKKFGKQVGKDIIERKGGNIVILYALKELGPSNRRMLLNILRKNEISQRDVKGATDLIRRTNGRKKAVLLGQKYINKAKKLLKFLPQNRWNKVLSSLADFVIQRER